MKKGNNFLTKVETKLVFNDQFRFLINTLNNYGFNFILFNMVVEYIGIDHTSRFLYVQTTMTY